MANIFWVISLVATGVCIFLLALFALPLSNKYTEKLARFLYKLKNILFIFIGIYLIVIYQEHTDLTKKQSKKEQDGQQAQINNYLVPAEFRAKRNYFITLCGITATIGLYAIISLSMSWGKKNRVLKERISIRTSN